MNPEFQDIGSRPSWVKCIRVSEKGREHGWEESLCGEDISFRWAFEDLEHAEATVRSEGRLVPCGRCLSVGKK